MKTELKKHPVTFLLVGTNILVFLCNMAGDNRLRILGSLYLKQVVVDGEWWRIVTACFLHADFMHIFNNMVTLLFMGMFIEEQIGKWPFLSAYACAGVGGNVASLLYKYRNAIPVGTIGASGAIFGLDGLLLAKVLFHEKGLTRIKPGSVLVMILLSVYSGFASPGVDNAAHVGGLVTGFIVGSISSLITYRRNRKLVQDMWR